MLIMTNSSTEIERPGAAPAATSAPSSAFMSPVTSPILSATNTTTPQSVLVRRQFPAVVFILQYASPDSLPSIQGVFMSLTNANHECRRLRELDLPSSVRPETPAKLDARVMEERKRDMGRALESWKNAEGVECWVEVHEVAPRKWVGRGSVSSVTHPPAPKLYENEEDDDEIVEDEEYHGFH